MITRTIEFRWAPGDGEYIDQPGKHVLAYDGPQTSAQMAVLITVDLAATNGRLDPAELLVLADRIESVQNGDPWPANIMSGVDGFVYFSQGVVLIGSSVAEESALLIEPDEVIRVLRSVHAVFTSSEVRNPEAQFDPIPFNVILDGEEAIEEYKHRGGGTSRWTFDPKKCTFTYEGQPEGFEYPNEIPDGYRELCE